MPNIIFSYKKWIFISIASVISSSTRGSWYKWAGSVKLRPIFKQHRFTFCWHAWIFAVNRSPTGPPMVVIQICRLVWSTEGGTDYFLAQTVNSCSDSRVKCLHSHMSPGLNLHMGWHFSTYFTFTSVAHHQHWLEMHMWNTVLHVLTTREMDHLLHLKKRWWGIA